MKYAFPQESLERIEGSRWLTDRQRQVFDLYYRRGWRIEDIAAELGVNRSTVNRVLKGIRQQLMSLK